MKASAVVLLLVFLAGCAPRERQAMLGAADPAQTGSPLRYRSVTADAGRYSPVAPVGWEEVNRRVAPRPGR